MTIALTLGTLDLRDIARYAVESHDHGTPDLGTNLRTQTLTITILGATPNAVAANLAAIYAALSAAEQAAVPNSGRTPITLVSQPGTNQSVTYDVLPDANNQAGAVVVGATGWSRVAQRYIRAATLTLSTSAYGRGARLVCTNSLLDSGDLTTANWTATNLTVTANAATAPNGDNDGATLRETTDDGVHELYQEITKSAAAEDWTAGWYVTPVGRTYAAVTLRDHSGSNGVSATFLLSGDGSIVTAATAFGTGFTAISAVISLDNHGAFRIAVSGTTNSATTLQTALSLRSDAATSSYAGTTTVGANAWGPTLQQSSMVGPYLKTGSSLTITNGDQSGIYLYGLPGDVPGLPRLTLSDVGTNVINDWRIGQRSVDFDSDFVPVLPITPEAGASRVDDDTVSDAIGSLTATQQPQLLGTFAKSGAYTDGSLYLFARTRDSTSVMGAPSGLTLTSQAIRGKVSSSTYRGASLSSHTLPLPSTPNANNLLRVAVRTGASSITTPSGWTAGPTASNSGKIAEFYKIAAGTETSIVIALGTSSWCQMEYEEVQGIKTSSPLDVSATNTGSGTTIATGTTTATAQANSYAVAVVGRDSGSNGAFSSWTNGFTESLQLRDQTNERVLLTAVKTLSATGTQTTTYTDSSDSSEAYIVVYKGLTTAAPAMPAGSYALRVAGVDANGAVGLASDAGAITLTATGAIAVSWTAPVSPVSIDHYRVYWKRDTGTWSYFETPDDVPNLTLVTESSPDGTTDPVTNAARLGEFRMLTALGSGTLFKPGPWVTSELGNSQFEMLLLGMLEGTPEPTLWGGDALGWKARIEQRHQTLPSTLDADAVWPLPAKQPLLHLWFEDEDGLLGGLDTSRDWRYDLRPDMGRSAVLFETGTTTEAGSFRVDGEFRLGPGSVVLSIMALIEGLVSDVTDCQWIVGLEYTPLYEYLAS